MRGMNSETIDLIYLDPPFNSEQHYVGKGRTKIHQFEDSWNEKKLSEFDILDGIVANTNLLKNETWWPLMEVVRTKHSAEMYFYLCFMAVRLLEMHRILKPTGSIYLHCDDSANSYIRLLLDYIFDRKNGPGKSGAGSEITWKRTISKNNTKKRVGRISDTIFLYHKTKDFVHNTQYTPHVPEQIEKNFKYDDNDGRGLYQSVQLTAPGSQDRSNWRGYTPKTRGWGQRVEVREQLLAENRIIFPNKQNGIPRYKIYLNETKGVPVGNIWTDINNVQANAKEDTGYPTQKPLELLKRIIAMSSNKGDLVFDPFCGCATALQAAHDTGRRFVGADSSDSILQVVRWRFEDRNKQQDWERQITYKVEKACPKRTDTTLFIDYSLEGIVKRTNVRKLYGYELYAKQNGKCANKHCKHSHVAYDFMDVDHKIPICRGGANDIDNLQLLCRTCNSKKKDKTMDEWDGNRV